MRDKIVPHREEDAEAGRSGGIESIVPSAQDEFSTQESEKQRGGHGRRKRDKNSGKTIPQEAGVQVPASTDFDFCERMGISRRIRWRGGKAS